MSEVHPVEKYSRKDIVHFKVFCLERYKYFHNMTGKEAFHLFKEYSVLDYIDEFYDVLHTFGDRYIVSDIEEFIAVRQAK